MTTPTILKGAPVAEFLNTSTRGIIALCKHTPTLVVVTIGDDEGSKVYVRQKLKAAQALGIEARNDRLAATTKIDEAANHLKQLAADPTITSIVLQLPLPPSFGADATHYLLSCIPPLKDPDCLSPHQRFDPSTGFNAFKIAPATPSAILAILDFYGIDVKGLNVTVIGRSQLVGQPLIPLLLWRNATLTICHSRTPDLSLHTLTADVIISATGHPHLVGASDVGKCGPQVLIDVGITRAPDGHLQGDFDIDPILESAMCDLSYTPVPGGVGPVTVASLMQNAAILTKKILGKE